MIKKDREESRFKRFLSGKAFYGVLAVCVFAVGVASFATIENLQMPESPGIQEPAEYEEPAGAVVSNIPNNSEEETSTEPETSASSSGTSSQTTEKSGGTSSEDNSKKAESSAGEEGNNAAAATVKPYEGLYMMPLNSEISKDYSNGELVYSDTMKDWRTHNGIDISASKNDQVMAVNDGTVLKVYTDPLWGGIVEIDHGNSIISRYCGVTAASHIKEGSSVQMGQEIGTCSTIPLESVDKLHLHFEVTVDGKIVDPLKAINNLDERGE